MSNDKRTDEEVLRDLVRGALQVNLNRSYGSSNGCYYSNKAIGAVLVARGFVRKVTYQGSANFQLSESALLRALSVGIDAAVADLLAQDPPEAKVPWPWSEESEARQHIVMTDHGPVVRGQ